MSPCNAAKYCVIPSCPCGRAGTAAACDRIKLFLFKCYVLLCCSKTFWCINMSGELAVCIMYFSCCHLRLYKIKSCMHSCNESHQYQADRWHEKRRSTEPRSQWERADRSVGDKGEAERGEYCHTKSLGLHLSPSKTQELILTILQRQERYCQAKKGRKRQKSC